MTRPEPHVEPDMTGRKTCGGVPSTLGRKYVQTGKELSERRTMGTMLDGATIDFAFCLIIRWRSSGNICVVSSSDVTRVDSERDECVREDAVERRQPIPVALIVVITIIIAS
jgi:hypothetical protein